MMRNTGFWLAILAFFIAYLLWLGNVHLFDWDEINFAEAAREMLVQREYLRVTINFQPFWEKPPLFIWFQALAMQAFGVGEFASRLPNTIAGLATLVSIWFIGKRWFSPTLAGWWVLAHGASVLPMLYFKSGIIDPWFNLFIFLAIVHYWQGFVLPQRARQWILAGLFLGLAVLTKGPTAIVIALLTMGVMLVWQRGRQVANLGALVLVTLFTALVSFAWFGVETWLHGDWFMRTFIAYQYRLFSTPDAGHKGFIGYHVVVLLVGCFPAAALAVGTLFKRPATPDTSQTDTETSFHRWMKALFWVVLVLFSIVESKIVHYSSMCYFPLTFFAAQTLTHWPQLSRRAQRWVHGLVWGTGLIYVLVTIALPLAVPYLEQIKPMINDPFAVGNLEADVHWTGWEWCSGVWLLGVLGVGAYRLRKNNPQQAGGIWLVGTAVFVLFVLVGFVKRVEGYSQRAALTFFEAHQNEDAYLHTHGYKSYAHLFYGRVKPHSNGNAYDTNWLLNGDIDKPVYISTKVHRAEEIANLPDIQELYRANGFVFFVRKPHYSTRNNDKPLPGTSSK